ncbi:hypothetical protein PY365_30760 [Roseiarcaceae bacterium H3SJ34-1]|uniref:hypothetical protein n=1 Tax=Terripilifer ovatus TaxID=3032367 RepID=UPI003AB959D8|nr:hypothetical protein [Roseiarcaceae bacterium H3SJ34-1]
MPKPIKHTMKTHDERLHECQTDLKKKFTKFWRKAQKKGWTDADIASAVKYLTESVPVALTGSSK